MKLSFYPLIIILLLLNGLIFGQNKFSYYKNRSLFLSSAKGEILPLGEELKIRQNKCLVTSKRHTKSTMPIEVLNNIKLEQGMSFYSALQSVEGNTWLFVERNILNSSYNFCLFDNEKKVKNILFSQENSPNPNYAFMPIAWSKSMYVVYVEALIFGSTSENEGIWAYNIKTKHFSKLPLNPSYMTTPAISSNCDYFLYCATADARKGLHSPLNMVLLYDIANDIETVVEKDNNSWFSISGWVDGDLNKSDLIKIGEEENQESASIHMQTSYKLPYESGTSFCVTRTGSGSGFTFPATCGSITCGPYSGDHGYEAIDFNIGLNTPILAVASGTVVFAWLNATGTSQQTGGYGNLVKIKHLDGTYSYYAHFSSIAVRVGDVVSQGCVLGKSGRTGHATGYHLHFEIRDASEAKYITNAGWPIFSEYDCTPNQNKLYTSQNLSQTCTNYPTLNCSNAVSLFCGIPYDGQTTGNGFTNYVATGDFSSSSKNSCNSWAEAGPEDIYTITTSNSGNITATLSNMISGLDLDVYILGSCNTSDCRGAVNSSSVTYANAPPGTYYILVDGYDSEYPSGSSYYGNYGAYTLTVTGNCGGDLPDLTIATGSQNIAPRTIVSGGYFRATCSVGNIGTYPAASSTVSVYLSQDSIFSPGANGDILIGSIEFPIISANTNSSILSKNFQIPSGTIEGSYYIFFFADANQIINEGNEDNNFAFVPVTISTQTDIQFNNAIPKLYNLSQNFPNPFNPTTTIGYDLPEGGIVSMKIYDIFGREVKTLVWEYKSAGSYKLEFNAGYLTSGTYFYRIIVGNFTQSKKFILMK